MSKTTKTKKPVAPRVGVIMGSDSDFGTMKLAADALAEFGIAHEVRVVSAHRTPDDMAEYGRSAATRGLQIIIAGAGGAAHLPGMVAALTSLPVLGVPVPSKHLSGLDSLLSIVQMPGGVPAATFAIGAAGAHRCRRAGTECAVAGRRAGRFRRAWPHRRSAPRPGGDHV